MSPDVEPDGVQTEGVEDSTLSRRDLLKKGAVLGAGIGAYATLGPSAAAGLGKRRVLRAGGSAQTIKLMSWVQFEPGRQDAWKALLDKYNKSQSKYNVEFTGWTAQQYTANVLTQFQAGGIQADAITLIPDLAARLVKDNALVPLDGIVKQVGVHPGKSHSILRKNGNLFGVSIVEVAFGLVYNPKLLKKAGISAPATTPEAWIAQLKTMTKKPQQFGLYQPNTLAEKFSFWFQMQDWINAYDGHWAKGRTPLLTSPPVIKTLKLYKDAYDNIIPQGSGDAAGVRLFAAGRVAEYLIVSAAVNVIKNVPGGKQIYSSLRSVPAPWPSRKQISRLHPIAIVASSKNQEGAHDFVTFMIEPENMAELMEKGLDIIPPYPEVLAVPGFQKYLDSLAWSSGYQQIDPVSQKDVEGDFVLADSEFGQIVISNLQRALTGGVSIEAAMADANKQAEALAKRVFV